MSTASTWSSLDIFRLSLAAILGMIAIAIIVLTWRWPMVWDAQVFHYTHFLIDNGFAPYRDIPDINMPGVYVLEGWAMQLFGGSDLGWRVYDFTLLAMLCAAMIVITLPYDWLAGLFAGVMFALLHANDGPWNSAERDEIMTVLIVVAYAFLFEGVRRRKAWLLLAFGLSLGMAATIKPTAAPLSMVLLGMAAWNLRKKGQPIAPYLSYSIAGGALAGATSLFFLLRHHALHAFFDVAERVIPFYAGLEHSDLWTMLRFLPKKMELVMLPFALAVAFTQKQWKNWERYALLLGIGFGAFSYLAQGKGYDYHRYPFAAFLLLWMACELTLSMRAAGWRRWVGVAGLTAGVVLTLPLYLSHVDHFRADNDFMSLQNDLASMGVSRLQHQVQCMDLVQGCYTALYHLKVVQSTGMIGDALFFATEKSPVVDYYRNQYWKELTSNPPAVIVLTNEWFSHPSSFDKINQWPSFAAYLRDNYRLVVARNFSRQTGRAYRTQEIDRAYRIYLRNGVSLPLPQNTG
ncbi:MAG TPA: hypothetical protein VGM02_05810 [Acidobacteriaceae bacterium]|jgi:hypothetical protein